ncbi:MAG: PspC domain-containing protein [Candidatus Hydrogenedentota bacterium]
MKLTLEQKGRIKQYLSDVAASLGHTVPQAQQDEALKMLREDIHRQLLDAGDSPDEGQVDRVLRALGSPAEQAARLSPRIHRGDKLMLTQDDRVWLGVCGGLAARLGQDPRLVRLICGGLALAGPVLSVLSVASSRDVSNLTLGIFTGSVALLAYLGLYGYMYVVSPQTEETRLRFTPIIVNVGITFAVALGLHYGTRYGLALIRYVHTEVMNREMPRLGEWGWFNDAQAANMLFWVLSICVPLAIYAGLPMANGWNTSLRRAGHAFLALYGVALAYGVANVLVGLILDLAIAFELIEQSPL